jgi:hypothetical protein
MDKMRWLSALFLAAFQFYSSPEGQRFARGATVASGKFYVELKEAQQSVLSHAQANFSNGLHKLIERYKADPR